MSVDIPIHGHCAPEFQAVKTAFQRNFVEHGELGAACCLYVEGECVVDLWGGWANKAKTLPWQENTLSGFYSVGKALVSLCALQVCDAYHISLDAPVADVWPEYGQHGKGQTTLRHFLTHRAGMPAIRERLPNEALYDWGRLVTALASQAPYWPPGSAHGYHTNTFGFLLGEFVRRVSGLSLGQYFQKHIAEPLNADVHFGLSDTELTRAAELDWPDEQNLLASFDFDQTMSEHESMVLHAYANPHGVSSLGVLNSEPWRQIEVPSTNGFGTAKGLARIFSALAEGGVHEDTRIIHADTLAEASAMQCEGVDKMLGKDIRWGLGFQLTHPNRLMGPNPNSFGHFGNGGSVGFADPDAKVGFAYTLNRIVRDWGSPQNRALITAIYEGM